MKPSDVYLGVTDFFSTLVPGAIAVFLVMGPVQAQLPRNWPYVTRASPEGWLVFVVSAYVLGHVVASIGALLDPLYDRWYARWRRASSTWMKTELVKLGQSADWWCVFWGRVGHVLAKTNPDDELLAAAKTVKRIQLREIAATAGVVADDISNTYWWAGTVVRAVSPAGAAEIDALSAQSKLFRSLTVLVLLTAYSARPLTRELLVGSLAALGLVLLRFVQLRWAATQRTYEYFIAARVLPRPKGEADGAS